MENNTFTITKPQTKMNITADSKATLIFIITLTASGMGGTFRNTDGTSSIASVSLWDHSVLCAAEPNFGLYDKIPPNMEKKQFWA